MPKVLNCPNKHLPEWRDLVDTVGDEAHAMAAFVRHNGRDIPDPATAKKLLGRKEMAPSHPPVPQSPIPTRPPVAGDVPRMLEARDTTNLQKLLSPDPKNAAAREEFRRQTGFVLPDTARGTNNRINEVVLGLHGDHPTVEKMAQQAEIPLEQAKQEQEGRRNNIQSRIGKDQAPSTLELSEFQGEAWADQALKDATLGPEADRNILQRLQDKIFGLLQDMKELMVPSEERSKLDRTREATTQHHERYRETDITEDWWGRTFDQMIPDPDRQMNWVHAFQQGRDSKWYQQLNGDERALVEWAYPIADRIGQVAIEDNGITPRELRPGHHYLKQWWTNPETGDPYAATYGKFARHGPSEKQKVHETYEEGMAAGLKPATTNGGRILGQMLKEAFNVRESRNMYGTLWREGMVHAKNDAPGLVYYADQFLAKPLVFNDPGSEGKTIILHGGVWMDESFLPFWRSYREPMKYGKVAEVSFALRGLKLALSLFHPVTLAKTSLELHTLNPLGVVSDFKAGAALRAEGSTDPVYRLLYTTGAETHGRDPTLPKKTEDWVSKIPGIGHLNRLIFDYVQPNLKWGRMKNNFLELATKRIPNFEPTETVLNRPDVRDLARQVVREADQFFSSEDVKRAGLESTALWNTLYFSPEARKAWGLFLLSPTWQRSHLLAAKNIGKAILGKTATEALGGKWDIEYTRANYLKYFGSALALYTTANAWNYIASKKNDGEGKLMISNPGLHKFGVRMWSNAPDGSARYLRPFKSEVEVAEMLYAVVSGDWRKLTGKLSPTAAIPLNQLAPPEGRNQYVLGGNVERLGQLMKDLPLPISVTSEGTYRIKQLTEHVFGQALLGQPSLQHSIVDDTLLPFFGMPVSRGPATAAEEEMRRIQMGRGVPVRTTAQEERSHNKQKLLIGLREGITTHDDLIAAATAGTINRKEALDLLRRSPLTHAQDIYQHLNAEEAVRIFEVATPTEKELFRDILRIKLRNLAKSDPVRFQAIWPQAQQLLENK